MIIKSLNNDDSVKKANEILNLILGEKANKANDLDGNLKEKIKNEENKTEESQLEECKKFYEAKINDLILRQELEIKKKEEKLYEEFDSKLKQIRDFLTQKIDEYLAVYIDSFLEENMDQIKNCETKKGVSKKLMKLAINWKSSDWERHEVKIGFDYLEKVLEIPKYSKLVSVRESDNNSVSLKLISINQELPEFIKKIESILDLSE